jgi:hypothetical protein
MMGRHRAAAWIWALAAKDANRTVLAQGADEIPPSATRRRPYRYDLVRDCVTVRRKPSAEAGGADGA